MPARSALSVLRLILSISLPKTAGRTFRSDALRRSDGLARLGQPRTGVLRRRKASALQERVGILVPLAVGIVVAEHRGGRLRLAGETHGVISLGQTRQRFLDLACVRIGFDHV